MKRFAALFVTSFFSLVLLSGQTLTIDEYVKQMKKSEGYFTFYHDENNGRVFLEFENIEEEFLAVSSLTAGLGSNNVGLDRNKLGSTKVVFFKKIGPKVLLVEPNYQFRAISDNADEVKAVTDAFATSVIFGFKMVAEQDNRVLIDFSPILMKDLANVSATLKRSGQGDYRIDASRSSIYPDNIRNFPYNSEFESLLTFTSGSAGNYVRSVAPDGMSLSLRQHLSLVKLPDPGFEARVWDPRASYGAISYMDFASPVDQPITLRFIRRHRLEKKDPSAKISDPVDAIIYYVDRGAPEPIRTALVEGASWWNEAFEAAGYRNAFQVKVLPEGADPMDVRYNMINWIHRSTRGWSYGSSVTDPRTGEIIKGHIALGSQRIRQDFLIASGLIAEYEEGKDLDPAIMEMALLRIRQLSCHEVGHTLGLNHNYAASANGRASVMDYPHPLIKLSNGTIDLSDAYTDGIGAWDEVSIKYGYSDFPDGSNTGEELNNILDTAFESGLLFLTDQDSRGTHPLTHVWDNGTHPVDELIRVMEIRKVALDSFTEKRIMIGESLSALEEVLVPVYLFHRYQIEASASVIGGLYYNHNVRGGTQELPSFVPAQEQYDALAALIDVISPENLAINEDILKIIPPRAPGLRQNNELFPGKTGLIFDPISAAENVATITIEKLLDPERAARLILFKSQDNTLPGLDYVLDKIIDETIYKTHKNPYYDELQRTVNSVVINNLILLAANKNNATQVRAIAYNRLKEIKKWINSETEPFNNVDRVAHYSYMLGQINFYFAYPDRISIPVKQPVPAGAPIGSY
jgi:hypothetical protein